MEIRNNRIISAAQRYTGASLLKGERCLPNISYSKMYLPALLAGTVLIATTAFYNTYRIDQAFVGEQPVGYVNKEGICYLASTTQIIDAICYARGNEFTDALTPGNDIIGAYAQVYADRNLIDFYKQHIAVNPQPMVNIWIRDRADLYNKHAIVECITHDDGTITRTQLCQEKIGNGSGGYVHELMEHILGTYAQRCVDLHKKNPFTSVFVDGSQAEFLWYDVMVSDKQYVPWQLNPQALWGDELQCAPDLTVLAQNPTPEGTNTPHNIPLYFTIETRTDRMMHTYRLLGAAYGVPVITATEGLCGAHAIAIVRYGETWYECDNHKVKTIGNGSDQAATRWIDRAARTTYEGKNLEAERYMNRVPLVICYERISTCQNQAKRSRLQRSAKHKKLFSPVTSMVGQ